jgi:CO/xanthine dehydrogenase FAD-binding subunit
VDDRATSSTRQTLRRRWSPSTQVKIVVLPVKNHPAEKFFVLPSVDFKRENILKPDEIVTEIYVPYPKLAKAFITRSVNDWPGITPS